MDKEETVGAMTTTDLNCSYSVVFDSTVKRANRCVLGIYRPDFKTQPTSPPLRQDEKSRPERYLDSTSALDPEFPSIISKYPCKYTEVEFGANFLTCQEVRIVGQAARCKR